MLRFRSICCIGWYFVMSMTGGLQQQIAIASGHPLRTVAVSGTRNPDGHPYTDHVPQSRDKRRRSDLDLFVLALIESGLTTPYELQISAGLSPGATIPALRRLVEGGWASPAKPGPRGRTEHRITAAGRRHLESSWRPVIENGPSGDGDADLRVALLALFVGGDRRLASELLRSSAKKIRSSLQAARKQPPQPDQPPLAASYQRLRAEALKSVALA